MAASSTASYRGSMLLLIQLSCSHSNNMMGAYRFGGFAESHQISLPSLHGMDGSHFPGLALPSDRVNSESVVGIKPGDSGVVIGYHVDEFTHTWSTEQCFCPFKHLSWIHGKGAIPYPFST